MKMHDATEQAFKNGYEKGYVCGYNKAMSEIVRCKDCKHYQYDAIFLQGWCNGRMVEKDDFCGYGERNKEKQIEEMAKEICSSCTRLFTPCEKPICNTSIGTARHLYNAGYRKQSHGTWYHGTESGAVYAKCSACGRKMSFSCYGYAYCALCGARMDGAKMKGGAE